MQKIFSKIKYPKLSFLVLIYVCIFYSFSFLIHFFENILNHLSYLGIFISGIFYTFSFTSSVGTIMFLTLKSIYNPITLALLGGLGAAIADVSILKLLKSFDLEHEFKLLSKENFISNLPNFLKTKIFLTIMGIITIASPLPDELGVLLISRGKLIKMKNLFLIGFISNAIGIYVISII